ncbi:electron transfer flavoprotein subunit alpha/FixB family protein [Fusobacterium nucleatum]
MGKNIMVYIETADNSPINVSLEALTLAKKISKENNEQVMAVLIGENLDEAAKKCFDYGADEVLYVEENKKELEAVGNALTDIKEKYNPSVIFLGSTINGKDLANTVASKMKTPAFVDAVNVKYENGKYLMTLPMYSGNILKEVTFEGDKTLVVAVRSGACKKEVCENAKSGEVKKEKAADKNLFTKIAEIVQEISETVNLEEAEVIVSGGRGMGSKENFELVKQLAEVCGGVVGATRPATEDEWIPRSHQVGQSGKIVAPKLYIACGISGATQHVSGIMGSNYIVAINKDEDAPIFDVADVGIVGNVMDIIPIMIEEIKKIKS